ncbi:hypothetical protein Zmor_013149 [Zophobas morio]|uniref:Peptidase M13 N-terminal domain-containing protein n=1 Tax=Zophobas morio TaxID=2755281 RepID=A0AA38ICJ7_9CUCU|nr:hypothetical protein Zmor_013149 [Zophobas morio]
MGDLFLRLLGVMKDRENVKVESWPTDSITILPLLTLGKNGGWPVIDPNWNERKFDWKQVLFRLRRSGWYANFFVAMQIDIDAKNSSRRILTITYPHFNYHSLSGVNHTDTQAHYDHMVRVLPLSAPPNSSANVEMNEVLEFEISLSKIVASDKASASEYNPMTIKELQESVHSIPWLQLINNYLAPEQMLKSRDVVNVTLLKFLKNLEDLLLNTNKRILANYMFWYIVKKCIHHLPQKFRERNFDYLRVVKGTARAARWDQCIKEIDKLNVAASYVYVKNFVNTGNKNLVKEMATYIFKKRLLILRKTSLGWIQRPKGASF